MALNLTTQAEAAIRAKGYYEQYEQRFSNYGAFNAYFTGGQALLPKDSIESFKNAQNVTALAFPVLTKASLSVITSNVCSFTGVEATSAKPTFSNITRGFAIKTYPKVAANNYISEMDQYAAGLTNGIRSVLANLDSYAVTQLEANKSTGLVAATGITGVSITANAYTIALAQRDKVYTYIPTLMELNDANTGNIVNAMHTNGRVLMLEYETKGQNQDSNLRGQLDGTLPSASGYRHFTSNRFTNGAGVSETHYLAPFGSLGLFTFIDSDARVGITDGVNGRKMYVMADPILGVEWAVTEEPSCDDLSATYGAGYEACNGTSYRFIANFSFMNAYSSDTTKPIHKLEVLTS
jgi:hypothetical protein